MGATKLKFWVLRSQAMGNVELMFFQCTHAHWESTIQSVISYFCNKIIIMNKREHFKKQVMKCSQFLKFHKIQTEQGQTLGLCMTLCRCIVLIFRWNINTYDCIINPYRILIFHLNTMHLHNPNVCSCSVEKLTFEINQSEAVM